ncbi:MAG: ABC transporter permease, partial [Deltaproteobacteria bacterium]|nr:ABC transporter permease [Deltaproteobacteria bacterium]
MHYAQYAIAALVAIHGCVHLVGFVVPWRLAELKEMPYSTQVFGG